MLEGLLPLLQLHLLPLLVVLAVSSLGHFGAGLRFLCFSAAFAAPAEVVQHV